jgi:hypothetical protein
MNSALGSAAAIGDFSASDKSFAQEVLVKIAANSETADSKGRAGVGPFGPSAFRTIQTRRGGTGAIEPWAQEIIRSRRLRQSEGTNAVRNP